MDVVSIHAMQRLFDALPDVVFFAKDADGRYTHTNLTLVRRLGLVRRDQVIGRRAADLFTPQLGVAYSEQDRRVLAGARIENHLEVHLFPNRSPGWCLTCKEPVRDDGGVRGLIGVSRDLRQDHRSDPSYRHLRSMMDYLAANFGETVRIETLARRSGVSVAQLERRVHAVFQLTPRQLLAKFRIDAAMRLLAGADSISAIGQSCGFTDQSAFSRQFKARVGMTPNRYRALLRNRTIPARDGPADSRR